MNIHFICSGNTFRSRMSEALLNSKKIKEIRAESSGTRATSTDEGAISWFAQRILQNRGIAQFTRLKWRKTTRSLLEKADFVVFFGNSNYEHCKKTFGFKSKKFEIWEIPDLTGYGYASSEKRMETKEKFLMRASEQIFEKITHNVDSLLKRLNQ